jgi:UDPglucose 6-dehydrogenase
MGNVEMRLAIIGSGYVGLVSGACLADVGHLVTCVDIDVKKVEMLQKGDVPIYEPGLQELISRNVGMGRMAFSSDIAEAVRDVDAIFIAVGTPTRKSDGHADLSYVYAAAEEIGRHASPNTVIITKSTVPIGTGDEIAHVLKSDEASDRFPVISNPEFLREGVAIGDFMKPDRIVIGSNNERATEVMHQIYKPLIDMGAPLVVMTRRSSELTKYAANAFLATKITFINEMADLCEKSGADVLSVSQGMGLDDRIGAKFLQPGPGYGGSCFPKDTLALLKSSEDFQAPQRIVETVVAVNEGRKRAMGRKILASLGPRPRGKIVTLLGLTFKPNTDDMRDSPSISIAQTLQDAGVLVRGCDPEGIEQAKAVLDGVEFFDDHYAALESADALAIVTEWDVYKNIDLQHCKQIMMGAAVVDLRNIFCRSDVEKFGLSYYAVGR